MREYKSRGQVSAAIILGMGALSLAAGGARPGAAQAGKTPLLEAGPQIKTSSPRLIQPSGPTPEWAPSITPQMQTVIEELMSFEAPPIPQLSAFQARNTPSPADAVKSLLMKTGMQSMPSRVDMAHRVLPVGPKEGVLVRTYTPLMRSNGPLPVVVYYHGGGWVIADLNTYEPSARALAEKSGAIVVSVAYRQAPEHPFPAAHNDSFAAYRWVTENAAQLGGDPARVAVAGESAGGNLAVAVALMARDRRVRIPVHILSIYPIADGDTESPSYRQYANAMPLNRAMMAWFFEKYASSAGQRRNPLISLVRAELRGLPPTTLLNAEIDPLRSDGEELAERLRSASVPVLQRTYPGVTHEFFGMAAVLAEAEQAQDLSAERLRDAFSSATVAGRRQERR